jgi:hypothetical protein
MNSIEGAGPDCEARHADKKIRTIKRKDIFNAVSLTAIQLCHPTICFQKSIARVYRKILQFPPETKPFGKQIYLIFMWEASPLLSWLRIWFD